MMGNMTRKLAAGVLGRENAGGGREWYPLPQVKMSAFNS